MTVRVPGQESVAGAEVLARRAPSPRSYGPLGHLPGFLLDSLRFLQRCRQRYGTVVALHLGGPVLLVTEPPDVQHILVHRSQNYLKCERITHHPGQKLWGDSLIALSGETHRSRRIALAPLFQKDAIHEYLEMWEETLERTLPDWCLAPPEQQLRPLLREIAQRGIFYILTGRWPDRKLLECLERRRRWLGLALRARWMAADPSGPLKEAFRDALATSATRGLIARWKSTGRLVPEESMIAELLSLSVAGFETPMELMEWSLRAISDNPQVVAQIQQGQITSQAVVEETLRCYPPTWMYVRVAQSCDVLPSGYSVAAGTRIYLCPYLTHREPDYWDAPEQFRPGRSQQHRFASFPFGGGSRRCPAEALARGQACRFLERFLADYHFTVFGTHRQRPRGEITLRPARPHFLWARARRKSGSESPGFSMVVATGNGSLALQRLLTSLLAQDYPREAFEVIVVDDGGTGSLQATVEPFYPGLQIRLLPLSAHGGPARHQGVQASRFSWIAFVDDDCQLAPNWLQEMAQMALQHPHSALGGQSVNALQDNVWSQASQEIMAARYGDDQRGERGTCFATVNLVVPRVLYDQMGGGDDREFCRRWIQRGFAMHFAPEAVTFHHHDLSLVRFWELHFRYGRGSYRFTLGGGRQVRLGPGFFVSLVVRSLRLRPILRGLWVAVAIVLAQVAKLGGYLRERFLGDG